QLFLQPVRPELSVNRLRRLLQPAPAAAATDAGPSSRFAKKRKAANETPAKPVESEASVGVETPVKRQKRHRRKLSKKRLEAAAAAEEARKLGSEKSDKNRQKKAAAGALIGGGEQGLLASKFRYLNEQLYTLSSADAFEMFKADPEAFKVYHAGYSAQRQRWTEDPIDWVAKQCRLGLPAGSSVLVDFGCGDARLASRLEGHCAKVHSLDLVALNNRVTACDMARCPLGNNIAHGAVFCLSLMNANLSDFLAEASRVLRLNGLLCIVEARSRIERTQRFVNLIERFGFQCQRRREDKYLVYLLFNKSRNRKAGEPLPELRLKPCLYKKR
uniref:Ribosomal RNA-processing protein 8 n=2 Tax=Macrostomum lignano TaxID=282301 RepID=A0A1I8IBI1_9PLAT